MDKRKKSLKIFYYGIISQVVMLLMGMILPRLLITNYGSEVNGLLSSIKQVFVYVSLLEAGIGTAALQALYAPFANDNKQKISEIMAATDKYFKRTGILYGVCVILLSIFYPLVIKSEISSIIIILIIFLQGASGVIKYFFQGKLTILLRVDGKSYITTNAGTISNVCAHLAQIILILLGANVIFVQVAYFLINLLQMLYISWYVKKHYSWLDLSANPNYAALDKSKFVIIHQISGLIFNNTDVLLLSYFCGLKEVSVYALYNLIFTCVSSVIDTLCSSVEFILGQAFNSDKKYFLKLQETYETYYLAISFSFFTITLIMIPSFMRIYASGVTDINYVDKYLPFLFALLNILMYARRTSSQIINFSGAFKETQIASIIESIINIVVSLYLVNKIGMYGLLIGTIAALIYRTNDIIIFANTRILKRSPMRTYRRWIQNFVICVVCVVVFNRFFYLELSFFQWIYHACFISICCFSLFFFFASLCDKDSFKAVKQMLMSKIKR